MTKQEREITRMFSGCWSLCLLVFILKIRYSVRQSTWVLFEQYQDKKAVNQYVKVPCVVAEQATFFNLPT